MTREEAIAVLKGLSENPLFNDMNKATFSIAIHDIKAYHDWNINNLILVNKDNYEPLEQEPTTKNDLGVDAVSRKAVINQIFYSTDNNGDVVLGSVLRERIARLPSVTPQLSSGLAKNSKKLEKDFGELDCISRADALRVAKNEYLRGWHNALCKALNEKYSIHCEEGNFHVIQEETITGLGLSMNCALGKDVESYMSTMPSVTPQELIHGKCNQCRYYEGVHNVKGHAPCSYHKIGGVLWNWYCSQFESEVKE